MFKIKGPRNARNTETNVNISITSYNLLHTNIYNMFSQTRLSMDMSLEGGEASTSKHRETMLGMERLGLHILVTS